MMLRFYLTLVALGFVLMTAALAHCGERGAFDYARFENVTTNPSFSDSSSSTFMYRTNGVLRINSPFSPTAYKDNAGNSLVTSSSGSVVVSENANGRYDLSVSGGSVTGLYTLGVSSYYAGAKQVPDDFVTDSFSAPSNGVSKVYILDVLYGWYYSGASGTEENWGRATLKFNRQSLTGTSTLFIDNGINGFRTTTSAWANVAIATTGYTEVCSVSPVQNRPTNVYFDAYVDGSDLLQFRLRTTDTVMDGLRISWTAAGFSSDTTSTFSSRLALVETNTAYHAHQPVRTNDIPSWQAVKFVPYANDPPFSQGQIFWDSNDHTIGIQLTNDVTQQVGQEIQKYVRNNTGSTITNGVVVYISGAAGNRPTIALASATNEVAAHATIGLATHNILNNSDGYITTFGAVRDLDTSAFLAGATLYLAPVAGTYTTNYPVAPSHHIEIGVVSRSNPANGVVDVAIKERTDSADDLVVRNVTAGTGIFNQVVCGTGTFNTVVTGTNSPYQINATTGSFGSASISTGSFNQLYAGTGSFDRIILRGAMLTYTTNFTSNVFSSNVLRVTHNLSSQYNSVTIYDDSNTMRIPFKVIADSTSQSAISFSGCTPVSNTWRAVFIRGAN